MKFIYVEQGLINGCGEAEILNPEVECVEVSDDVFQAFQEHPDCYEYQGGVIALNPEKIDAQAQAEALNQKKTQRADAVDSITVKIDGMVFDGNEVAQDRMARAITMFHANNLPADTVTHWVLADNSIAEVTVAQLSQALLLAGQAQTALWTAPYEE